MKRELTGDGLEVDVVEPLPGRVNIVAKHKGPGEGPRVMMYSHYDVVPAGDLGTWKHPPFGGEVSDGYIWGRGAQDDKVATCGLTMAYRALRQLGVKLRGEAVFTHVGDEERGGRYGFQEVLNRGYGEGVDCLFYAHGGKPDQIGIAANGSRGLTLTVKGRSAHTAQLEEGQNAIVDAAALITDFQELADRVNARSYSLPGTDSVMKSRFSVNRVHGGVANNNVPDTCEIFVDRRYTPGETEEQMNRTLNFADEIRRRHPGAEVPIQPYVPLPGTLLYQEAVKAGFKPPTHLEGWKNFTNDEVRNPWIKNPKLLNSIYINSFLAFRYDRFLKSFWSNLVFGPLHKLSLWRWKNRNYKFFVELYLYLTYKRLGRFFIFLEKTFG